VWLQRNKKKYLFVRTNDIFIFFFFGFRGNWQGKKGWLEETENKKTYHYSFTIINKKFIYFYFQTPYIF